MKKNSFFARGIELLIKDYEDQNEYVCHPSILISKISFQVNHDERSALCEFDACFITLSDIITVGT